MSELPPYANKSSFGGIAQLVEQMTFNHWVQGSSPCASTKELDDQIGRFFIGTADENPVRQ